MFISVVLFISSLVIFVKKVGYCMYCRLLSTHFQVDLNRIGLYKTMVQQFVQLRFIVDVIMCTYNKLVA